MRKIFLRWLMYKICKYPVATIPPKWFRILRFLFFPLHAFYENQSGFKYEVYSDVYTIQGIKIHGNLFHCFSNYADTGSKFLFIKNEGGIITVEQIK